MDTPMRNQDSPSQTTSEASKKSVRWSTITVYEFDVAIGGSAVPRHGGPSVGLAKKPTHVWSTSLNHGEVGSQSSGNQESTALAQEEEEEHCPDEEGKDVQHSRALTKIQVRHERRRRNRVRWIKPFERVAMLTRAGLSEKRICRMMNECAAICMSRRISIRSAHS